MAENIKTFGSLLRAFSEGRPVIYMTDGISGQVVNVKSDGHHGMIVEFKNDVSGEIGELRFSSSYGKVGGFHEAEDIPTLNESRDI